MGHVSLFAARPGSRIATLIVVIVSLVALSATLSGAAELKLPRGMTETQAKRMYSEQVYSAASIDELVEGDIGRFEVTGRRVGPKDAGLNLRVIYKTGVTRQANMKLVKVDGRWYFNTITAVGRTGGDGAMIQNPDLGVLNTMLKEQSAHATATAGLVDGTYSRVLVGTPVPGYRSVVIPVEFAGKKSARGEVTAVKRTESGRDQWFIVSFGQ